mgnify:FL=1
MSIKDLFSNYSNKQFQKSETPNSASALVESLDYIDARRKETDRFIPAIDFSDPSKFSKFGSAELYYENAFKRIYQEYPYDGTLAEKIEFENSSSYLDLYVLGNLYPRTNGYAKFSVQGKTITSSLRGNSLPTTKEYIRIFGGPHTASSGMIGKKLYSTFDKSMIYDPSNKRGSSLEVVLSEGATIEFWLKKASPSNAQTHQKEVIFDLWNGEATGSSAYGRMTLYLTSSNDALNLTLRSGSHGFDDQQLLADAYDGLWHNYALTLQSSSAGTGIDLYKDNVKAVSKHILDSAANSISGIVGLTTGSNAAIGSLYTSVSGNIFHSLDMLGYNKLSGSLDEFRFWKTARTHEEISNTRLVPVGGGTNRRDPNINLGFYYKFNEGITGDDSVDLKVLDYSGRIADGIWVGYSGSNTADLDASRITGSAIVESGAALREFKDPIVYSSHPDVTGSITRYKTSGSLADLESTSMFYRLFPGWMQETDTESGKNLKYLCQIIGSYFDTIWHQINSVSTLHDERYVSGSDKPLPFAKNLLYSKGFVIPDLFVEATVPERFRAKDDNEVYEKKISEVRDIIYHNLYNNLVGIYKSKGTEKAFRNFFRSLGIGNELVKLKLYADDSTYVLRDNYEYKSFERNYLNFNFEDSFDATLYQTSSTINAATYISGSPNYTSLTLESEIILPRKARSNEIGYIKFTNYTASVLGYHSAVPAADDYTWDSWRTDADYDLGVFIVKEKLERDLEFGETQKIRFLISGSNTLISSSVFNSQYENNKWNLALRIKHDSYPFSSHVSGAAAAGYTLELHGVEAEANIIRNSFLLTGSLTNHKFVTNKKRIWAGAHKTNFTGSTLQKTDIKLGYVRYWSSYLSNEAINQHAYDSETFGANEPFESDTIFLNDGQEIPRQKTLALHWAFFNKTGSTPSGELIINDLSSGSANSHITSSYGIYNGIVLKNNEGKATGFRASSTNSIDKNFIYTARKKQPDDLFSSDLVVIKDDRSENFFVDEDVSDNFYSFEKSLHGVISDEMLNMFSTALDFNNLIGQPNQRYHHDYSLLSFLKERFFEDVENTPNLDKFTSFYKWIDDSISIALEQLYPASSRFSKGIKNVVESHVLERNKYVNKIGILGRRTSTEGSVKGIQELLYDWQFGHAPVSGGSSHNCLWQADRKKGETNTAETLRIVKNNHSLQSHSLRRVSGSTIYYGSTYTIRKLSKPYRFEMSAPRRSIHGGINYARDKNVMAFKDAILPHGSLETGSFAFLKIPKNVIVIGEGLGHSIQQSNICNDVKNPNEKIKLNFIAKVGNRFGDDYKHALKGDLIVPMTLVSGTVNTGYNRYINTYFKNHVIVTNIHSDTTDHTNEIPMQGPFTKTHVGGQQSRHVGINKYDPDKAPLGGIQKLDSARNRPEAWGLVPGELTNWTGPIPYRADGAMGYVSADYGGKIYPNVDKARATKFRDEYAKRPLNVRNIRHSSGSAIMGNYRKGYEIVTLQKGDQRRWYRIASASNLDLPTSIKNSLPLTTNYMTLVGQAPFLSGNVFGVANNNRQPDVESLKYQSPWYRAPDSTINLRLITYSNDIVIEIPKTNLTKSTYEICSRFSAPGGPEVQSMGYLDAQRHTYSVHNALPFRNLTVRMSSSGEPEGKVLDYGALEHQTRATIRVVDHLGKQRGLQSVLASHMGKFGRDLDYGVIHSLSSSVTSGSFVKQHRNISRRMQYGIDAGNAVMTGSRFDNGYISSPIPRSDFQYSWIRSALSGATISYGTGKTPHDQAKNPAHVPDSVLQKNWRNDQVLLGYSPPNGLLHSASNATGVTSSINAINFPTASTIYGYITGI